LSANTLSEKKKLSGNRGQVGFSLPFYGVFWSNKIDWFSLSLLQIISLAYSPDGQYLAAGDTQRQVIVYELSSGNVSFSTSSSSCFCVAG